MKHILALGLILTLFLGLTSALQLPNTGILFSRLVDRAHSNIRNVIHKERLALDQKLEDLFPRLKPQIQALRDINSECYDQTIGTNTTVNIFKEKVHTILHQFASAHPKLWQSLAPNEMSHRIRALVGNLRRLARLLIDCVKAKAAGKTITRLGLTALAIFTPEEFRTKILNPTLGKPIHRNQTKQLLGHGGSEYAGGRICDPAPLNADEQTQPASFDWRTTGHVTPVYHQQDCMSCYVFTAMSALESQYLIKRGRINGQLPRFSVQATLNCMQLGCGGGELQWPLEHMVQYGVTWEQNAPYISGRSNKVSECRTTGYPVAVRPDSFCFRNGPSDEEMQRLIRRIGPAGVAVDANSPTFQYLKGPFHSDCGTDINHAVMVTGWNEKYWLIKNSWSTDWGVDGYLYLPRGEDKCGVNAMIGGPVLTK